MIKNKLITLFSKIIIIILVFGLLINHINLVLIVQAFDKPPNMTIQDESINEIVDFKKEELVNKKTKNSKTFKYDNGLLETEIYNKRVHFLDNGKYVNIDNTLKEYEDYYKNNNNSYQVTLPKSLKDRKVELEYLDYNIKISYDNIDSNAFLKYDIDRNIENLHDSIYYQINDKAILKYDILNESIKENIILTNYIDNFSFSYFLETDLSFQNENGKLYFYNNDNELIFIFDNYLMYDLDYNVSYDILVEIKQINEHKYRINVIPNNEYLESANYPVIIDPEIYIVDGGNIDGLVTLYEVDKLNNTSTFKSIGSFNVNNRIESTNSDDLIANFNIHIPRIYNTDISELLCNNQLMYANLELTTLNTNAINNTSAILKYDNTEIDRVTFHNINIFNHKFNIIDALSEEIDNFINNDLYFNLELYLSGSNNTNVNYSLGGDLTGNKPIITLGYLDEAGLSDYYTYENFPINNESNLYVAHNSGNLTYVYEDYVSDNLINLSHIYNTNRINDSIYGSGFSINYNEYILEANNGLKLYKGSGKIIEFVNTNNNEYLSKDGSGEVITKIYNGNTLLKYELKSDETIYEYNSLGNLVRIYLNENDRINGIWDSDAKKINIIYNNGLISKIEDSYGNYIELNYAPIVNYNPTINQVNMDYLADVSIYKINPQTNTSTFYLGIMFNYESGKLAQIIKEYNTLTHRTCIEYNTRNQISKIHRNYKGYTFNYDNRNRISKVKVYNGNLSNGDYLDFSYNKNGKETYIINSKEEVIKYSFDNYYHTVKQEGIDNYTTFYRYYDIYQDNNINYNLNHKIINQSNSFKNISNIITNHGFEIVTSYNDIYGWVKDLSGTSQAMIDSNNYLYGSRVLKLTKGSGEAKLYQELKVEQGSEYIISGYIKNENSGNGAYIDVVGLDGIISPTTRTNNIRETASFNRYEYKFTSSFTGRVRIYLVNESTGNAYFDNIDISNNYIDTRYNYLENSSFENYSLYNGIIGWNENGGFIEDNFYFDNNSRCKSLKLTTLSDVSQTINKTGLTGDTFIFGGYCKYENYTGDVIVSLTFNYINGSYTTYSYTYNNPVFSSEYYMIKAEALSDYISITLSIENNSLSSYAWIDNFSIYNETYGINISYNNNGLITSSYNEINDTSTTYTYDTNNNIINITTNNDSVDCSYDTRGNLNQIEAKNIITNFEIDNDDNITEIVIENSDPNGVKYYYGSTIYSSNGLYPIETSDVFGNITTTTYDYLTGLATNIIDSNSRFTSFSYNDLGNVTSITQGKNTSTKTVSYTYDVDGNLTYIAIGNTIYSFTYNSYNDITSISINNDEIISYNYDNNSEIYRSDILSETHPYGTIYFNYYDNGLVESISKGNTKILEYIYNDYGEIASIIDKEENVTYYNYDYLNRLINVSATNGNNITYEYDDESRLVNKTNLNGTSTYTYSDISNNNDYIDERLTEELISNIYKINYSYTSDDYSNLDVINFYINNNLIFDKEFKQEKININNQDYYTGRISEIEYTIGNDIIRYAYTYDDYSNITEIIAYTNNIITYHENNAYDCFNQLIWQVLTINGIRYLTEYGYDSIGNIVGYYTMNLDTYDIIHSASFTFNNKNQMISSNIDGISETYSYQNSLITSYDGFSVGYTFGKISSLINNQDEIIYYYNANDLRTAKEVNGTTTYYILEGSNIIREITGNNIINYYYDNDDNIIGFSYNNQKYLYLKNLQNDVTGIIDSNGNIVVKYYYDAYGNIIDIIDISLNNIGDINPFRYRSYYYDNETGWYYLNSRYYDPLIKRFITPDDINYLGVSGNVISYNLYCYCENNPVNLVDYDGNDAIYVADCSVLPIAGHAVLYYEYNGDWYRTEFLGTGWDKRSARIYNYKTSYSSAKSIIRNLSKKSHYLYIKGNFNACYEYANFYAINNETDNKYQDYSIFSNNCLHYVRKVIMKGTGIKRQLDIYIRCSITIVPTIFFRNAAIVDSLPNNLFTRIFAALLA